MLNITIDKALLNGWEFDDPPTLETFEFEKIDLVYWNDFLNSTWHWSFCIGAVYILTIYSLQCYMRHKKPFDLKYLLFLWNVSLAVFSIIGFFRVTPPLFNLLSKENGLYNSICAKRGLNLPNILWGLLFLGSKVVELGDTIFIVLRKRPLKFLHWYHHLVTLIACAIVAPIKEPIDRCYVGLNYFVHSFMYPYFALKVVGIQIPSFIARLITILQFAQMIAGLFLNMASYYYIKTGHVCERHPLSIAVFSIVYGTFAVLFGLLLLESFAKVKKEKLRKEE